MRFAPSMTAVDREPPSATGPESKKTSIETSPEVFSTCVETTPPGKSWMKSDFSCSTEGK